MQDNSATQATGRLTLRGWLDDLGQVLPWVEALAGRYAIPPRTVFAIDLCLEEALSNIVRHGYKGDESKEITVAFHQSAEGGLVFVIEDEAPFFRPFDPAEPAPAPSSDPLEEITPGGQGIRLIRKFADSVEWEPLENGNRLTLAFVVQRNE